MFQRICASLPGFIPFLLAASLLTSSPAEADPPDGALRTITANTQGNTLEPLNAEARRYRPHVIALQEVCASHMRQYRLEHPRARVAFTALTTAHPHCPTGRKGQALITPHLALRNVTRTPLGGDVAESYAGRKRFLLTCGTVRAARTCSVHFRAGSTREDRAGRVTQARATVAALARYPRVVVAGDLNAGPSSRVLRIFYRAGYLEADRRDRDPTRGRSKLDHVLHKGGRPRASGAVRPQPTSDHDMLRAWRR